MCRLIGICFAAVALCANSAHADFEVDSPNFDQGALVLDSNNSIAIDPRSGGARSNLVDVAYGVTDWWQPVLQGEFDKMPGADDKYNVTNVQNTFAFTKPGTYWANPGVELNYSFAHGPDAPNVLEGKFLLEKTVAGFLNDANLIVDKEVGAGSHGGANLGLAWKTEYQYMPMFNPGFEFFGNLNRDQSPGLFDADQRRLGPVFYGDLGHGLSYELGWLFGLSRNAEDNVIKLNLSFEIPIVNHDEHAN